MGSRRGGGRSQGSVRYFKIELLESRCVLSGSPWAAATHVASLRSDSARDFDSHLAETYFSTISFGDQGGGNDFAFGASQFSITESYGYWRNGYDFDGSRNDGFASFNRAFDAWQDGFDSQSNWQSSGGSLSLSSSGSGSLNLQSTDGDQSSNSAPSSPVGLGLGLSQSSSGDLGSATTQNCSSTSDSASTGSPSLSLGSSSTITISSPTIPSQPPTEIDISSSNGGLGGGLALGPPPGGLELGGPTLSIPAGVDVTISISASPPALNSAVGVNLSLDGGHSHSIDPNVSGAVQPALNVNLAAAVNLAQSASASVSTQPQAIDVVATTSGHASSQSAMLSHVAPTIITTTSTASASIPMIAASGSLQASSVAHAAMPGQTAGVAHLLAGGANQLTTVRGNAKLASGAKSSGDSDHTPAIAGMPVSLVAVNHAIDTVMSQVGTLETGFSRWWDDQHINPAMLVIGTGALGAAATVYARRRFKRKLDEIEDEASQSWLFARMQTASAE